MGAAQCKQACDDFCYPTNSEDTPCSERTVPISPFCNVPVQKNGCRQFPRLPPPGQHPRLFFTAEELPQIVARFHTSGISTQMHAILRAMVNSFTKYYEDFQLLAPKEQECPTSRETIDKFFVIDEARHSCVFGAYVQGFLTNDKTLLSRSMQLAVFHAKVILRSKEIARTDNVRVRPYDVWHTNKFEVGTAWAFGGSSYALAYDIMYNDLPQDDRNTMRRAIATAVRGRRSWGMAYPTRRIQSNWSTYHGDLFVLNAVIEDEEGFDFEVHSMYSDLIVHFMDYAIYESGHPVEDAYAVNLAFREGSLAFIALARRGHNIFSHPHFKAVWTRWLPYAFEPHNSGKVYGGASGSIWEYPTSAIVAKYMYPQDPIVDFVFRHFTCENGIKYQRLTKWQSRIPSLLFALPALSEHMDEPEEPEKLKLPLTWSCKNRGKVILRSNWTENAMWYTLDARPDAFLIGHDTCSRGVFVLNADGRCWCHAPEWKHFELSSDYSLPRIDDVGQQYKAPSVKLLGHSEGAHESSFASADLTYAYNWQWYPHQREGQDLTKQGYEREESDPQVDFGMDLWWLPNKLYDERNVGFTGLHCWRKRIDTVKKVFRSALMVRATNPYMILADDVKKDNDIHTYTWTFVTPMDVKLASFNGRDAILQEDGERGRRFLLRSLAEGGVDLQCKYETYAKINKKTGAEQFFSARVIFSCTSKGAYFKFLCYSLPTEASEAPVTTWERDGATLHVQQPGSGEKQTIVFGTGDAGETTMTVAA